MAGRHGNKGVISRVLPEEDMPFLPNGTPLEIVLNPLGVPSRMNIGQVLEVHLGLAAKALGWKIATPVFDGATEDSILETIEHANKVLQVKKNLTIIKEKISINNKLKEAEETEETVDEPKVSVPDIKDEIRENIDVINELLKDEIFDIDSNLGLMRDMIKTSDLSDLTTVKRVIKSFKETPLDGIELNPNGKIALRDGRTGEYFDNEVTVGYMYILKLLHLVDDKIHARSTGPYSLVTQQPLGGKAQFGGQRFGEMEVWALEAYGASHTLQEILTVKSDDVVGRVKTYESIVKGENIPEPGVPESFKVLIKELQSLSLDVKVLSEENEEITIKESVDDEVEDLSADMEVREDVDIATLSYKGEARTEEDLYDDYDEDAETTEDFDTDIDFEEILMEDDNTEDPSEDDEF